MKPLLLQLEGLTAYRRPTRLDFEGLELFAITGPTGSGKSSLLDAITFALYGEVERIGRRVEDLISHGARVLRVVLEFEHQGRRFRVGRSRRRGGGGEAILEELLEGKPLHLASGIREVDRKVGELLGLPYEAFVQAAILPQGAFARFLKGEPKRRREVLRQLLGLERYKRMQELASQERRALERELFELESRLQEDFADATEERLSQLEEALRESEAEEARLKERLQEAREAFRQLEARYLKARELLQLERELERLQAREGEIASKHQLLERAERAERVWPLYERWQAAGRRLEEASRRFQEIGERFRESREALARARARLEEVQREAAPLPELRERWLRLGEVAPLLEMERHFKQRRLELEGRLKELEGRLKERDRLEAQLLQLEEEVGGLEARLLALDFDRELLERLEAHQEAALSLREKEGQLAELEGALPPLQEEALRAEARCRELKEQLSALEERLSRRRLEETVQSLRRHLHLGQPCPVCLQEVRQLPELSEGEAGADLAGELLAASERYEAACRERERLEARLALLRERQAALSREISRLTEKLLQAFPGLEPPVAERLLARYRELGERRRAWEEAARELEARRAARERLRQEVEALRRLEGERGRLLEELGALSRQLEEIASRIGQVTDHPDPEAERRQLKALIDRLEGELSQAQRELEEVGRRHAQLEGELEARKEQFEEEEAALREAERLLEEALAREGFASLEALEAAHLPPEARSALMGELERFREECLKLRERILAVREEVGPAPPTEEAFLSAREGVARLEGELLRLREQWAVLAREVAQTRSRLERAAELRERASRLSKAFRCFRQLAEDLRDDRFQEFLLNELFEELVLGASGRLFEMTGRYRLHYREGSFFVVDEEHGGERRRAETLSGGETFLASLALALELSEQVCRHAGGVVLESLFIDEGFGTLDPEALENVASVLEGLRAGGRMVGVITHLSELAERLPARIEVRRSPEGARLKVFR